MSHKEAERQTFGERYRSRSIEHQSNNLQTAILKNILRPIWQDYILATAAKWRCGEIDIKALIPQCFALSRAYALPYSSQLSATVSREGP